MNKNVKYYNEIMNKKAFHHFHDPLYKAIHISVLLDGYDCAHVHMILQFSSELISKEITNSTPAKLQTLFEKLSK